MSVRFQNTHISLQENSMLMGRCINKIRENLAENKDLRIMVKELKEETRILNTKWCTLFSDESISKKVFVK